MPNGLLSPAALIVLLGTSVWSAHSFQAAARRSPPPPGLLQLVGEPNGHIGGAPCAYRPHLSFEPFVAGSRTALSSSEGSSDANDAPTTGKISIVYCVGCRWLLRAAYFAQELLTTFQDDLTCVTLVPSRPPAPGGTFLVTLDGKTVWNRKSEGGFPETKELKQRIRDLIAPDRDLGHSDVSDELKQQASSAGDGSAEGGVASSSGEAEGVCDECPDGGESSTSNSLVYAAGGDVGSLIPPHVSICYCTGCKWMFRAAWYAQEILSTFQEEVNSVSLVPSRDVKGTFTVTLNDEEIWDRKTEGRHAEAKELKQRIRDVVVPDRNLGHSDVKTSEGSESAIEELDDDDAAEQRQFFGVM